MEIYGKRVLLRAIERTDKELLRSLMNDPEIEQLLGGWSFPISDDNQEEWIKELHPKEHTMRCIIEVIEDKIAIGTVILSDIDYKNGTAEIHIKLSKDYSGRGYGTDTLKAVITYAFCELRLHCVYALILEHNRASQRLFEKFGFQKEGILRSRIYKKGGYQNQLVYSILSEDAYGDRE